MDALTPQTVTPTGARRILNMTKRDDAEDLRRQEELERSLEEHRFIKKQRRQEITARNLKLKGLRRKVKRAMVQKELATLKWQHAVKELEEALRA